jgi:carbamoyltransferase
LYCFTWKGEEWKVMGLAAYGQDDPRSYRALRSRLRVEGLRLSHPRVDLAAMARLYARRSTADAADLARAGQKVFEDVLIELCRHLRALDLSHNVVLGGGCALNSSANGRVLRESGFAALHVPCAPADDGNALGAALLAYYQDHPSERPPARLQQPFLGSDVDPRALGRLATSGAFPHVERLPDAQLARRVASSLAAGELVGFMQGRAELGPRALGNRSILADPRRADTKARINDAVKFREGFRPLAPAILPQHGREYFDDYADSPYMERSLVFRSEVRARVPAVVHVDGTGRLQSVREDWSPRLHGVLSAFHAETGVPVLLNTSFNVMGKPIVHSVEDAAAVFATSGLDVLVIDDHVFRKRAQGA